MKPSPRPRREPPAKDQDPGALQAYRDQHTGRLLLHAYRSFKALATEMLRERGHEGLGTAHTSVLPHIHVDGTRLGDVARGAGMTKQAAAEVVQDLERQGYVERVPDPEDGRAVRVRFTRRGGRFLRDAHLVKQRIEARYAAALGEDGLRELCRMLAVLAQDAAPTARDAAPPTKRRPKKRATEAAARSGTRSPRAS